RLRHASWDSSASHFPPGKSQQPSRWTPRGRRVTRKASSRSMTAAGRAMRPVTVSPATLVFRVEGIRRAARSHRAEQAFRFPGGAQGGAEVHERLIEIEYVAHRQHRTR